MVDKLCETAARRNSLAPRERQVLGELLDGRTEARIAERLSISPHTVHAHIRSLYAKLRVHSRVELMRRVLSYADDPLVLAHAAAVDPRDGSP